MEKNNKKADVKRVNYSFDMLRNDILTAPTEDNEKLETGDKYLREYVLDESLRMDKFYLLSWVYPYSTIQISRDFAVKGHYEDSHPRGLVSIIASAPLAFMISSDDEG